MQGGRTWWDRDEMRREGACEVGGKWDATCEASRQPSVFTVLLVSSTGFAPGSIYGSTFVLRTTEFWLPTSGFDRSGILVTRDLRTG
jgi:hypothetical protein